MRAMLLAATLVAGLGVGATGWAEPTPAEVVDERDFQALGEQAEARDLPILVMFSSPFCSYCETVEEDFLVPMLKSGDYDNRVLIRKVEMIVGGRELTDFTGGTITVDALASRYDITLTPTVVFLDSEGQRLADNLVGLTTTAYYGGYLDDGIDTALKRLGRVEAALAQAGDEPVRMVD